jgi:hypothetical protein
LLEGTSAKGQRLHSEDMGNDKKAILLKAGCLVTSEALNLLSH